MMSERHDGGREVTVIEYLLDVRHHLAVSWCGVVEQHGL